MDELGSADAPSAELEYNVGDKLARKDHLVLPTAAKLEYLNEGAANIVYKLAFPSPQVPLVKPMVQVAISDECIDSEIWDFKLLRLRKNLPTTKPCALAQEKFEKFIMPLFEDGDFVRQALVEISSAGIVKLLNKELEEWDRTPQASEGRQRKVRLEKRHGVYLADDKFGLLIDDMSPNFPHGVELIEFKPKWLAQSPNAPRSSKRCRTCAVYARNTALLARTGSSASTTAHFCPLDLLSKDINDITRAAKQIIGYADRLSIAPTSYNRLWRFVNWIQATRILPRLKKMQELHDSMGVLIADAWEEDCKLLTAMTLRDVTCYVRYPAEEDAPLEARIGDLDLKSPEKHAVWKIKEAELIAEGWYEGTEKEEDRQPFVCNLYPYEWTPKKERNRLVSRWMLL